ncbi:MAG: lipase family protein [Phaeodactylibacter sp.]|nr:lipase family protein [Phaeodactylibacter sp.]MCB9289683.1 lipase family protein [Lewinellaceae bacterium]
MPAPSQKIYQESLSVLQNNLPLPQQDFFNLAWGFALHSDPGRFLLETGAYNKKLAETLMIFRKRIGEAVAGEGALEPVIGEAFLHYIVNTDGIIPESEGDDPFDVFDAATRYGAFLNVGISKKDDGTALLEIDEEEVPGPECAVSPGWSAAWTLRKVMGPAINRVRYGRDDVIPSFAFGFDENAEGHTLQNALTLADFSHLAYFGADYVEKQLKQWGYEAFRWIEDEKTDTQAFVTARDGHLVACFRGTSSGKDALVDTRFRKTAAYGGRGRVHRGFHNALDSVWDQMQEAARELGADKKLFLCGHSLGAALAQLAAHRFALEGYTVAGVYVFGSPRVGNPEYRDAYNELLEARTFLHINNKDIVARVPPRILGFRHLGGGPRLFDEEHLITIMPKPRAILEEEEMDFEDLDEETQEKIRRQMLEAQRCVEASSQHPYASAEMADDARSRGLFDVAPVDDHSMDEYLFKFGCATVDESWKRLREEE